MDHLHRVFDLIGREDDFDDELILAAEGANAFHDCRPMREVRDDEIAQIRIVGDDLETIFGKRPWTSEERNPKTKNNDNTENQ